MTHALLAWRARNSLEWLSIRFYQHSAFIHLNGGLAFGLVQVVSRSRSATRRIIAPGSGACSATALLDDVGGRDARRRGRGGHHAAGHRRARAGAARSAHARRHDEEHVLGADRAVPGVDRRRDARSLEADYRRLLADEMFPAIRRLSAFVRNDYLPKARTTDGFGALPGGDRMYRLAVRYETTTDLTPDEIHELGLREVKRVQASYLAAAEKAGFSGKVGEVRPRCATTKTTRSRPASR